MCELYSRTLRPIRIYYHRFWDGFGLTFGASSESVFCRKTSHSGGTALPVTRFAETESHRRHAATPRGEMAILCKKKKKNNKRPRQVRAYHSPSHAYARRIQLVPSHNMYAHYYNIYYYIRSIVKLEVSC